MRGGRARHILRACSAPDHLASLSSYCSSRELSSSPAKIKPADIPSIAAAVKDDAPALNRIEQIIDLGSEAVPALVPLAGSQNEAERYTAIAALGRIGTADGAKPADIEATTKALAGRLDDPNVSLRAYAAGGLVAMGDKRGVPVLIEALSVQQRGYLSAPPPNSSTPPPTARSTSTPASPSATTRSRTRRRAPPRSSSGATGGRPPATGCSGTRASASSG